MNKELIRENVEKVKFRKWQDLIRIKVQEAKESALVKISIIRESFRNV